MERIHVSPSARKHGLADREIREAWSNYVIRQMRNEDCWIAIGFSARGMEIEMVALMLADGSTLIVHAMSPSTEKMRKELRIRRGRI